MLGTALTIPSDQNGATPRLVTEHSPLPVSDPWIEHAIQVIQSTYGDTVSIPDKAKDLLKFGHTHTAGTSSSTVAHMPTGQLNETYLAANSITHISSSNAADNVSMKVEGHTVDGSGNFTFVVQSVTLTGTTAAALTTPLARSTRMYNDGSTNLLGNIYVHESGAVVAGIVITPTGVHLMIEAGENQSEKCSTTIENNNYWILTGFGADFLKKTAGFAEVVLQVREKGKTFRNRVRKACSDRAAAVHKFEPYYIVTPNSDVRITVVADSANTDISGYIQGVLAVVV